MSHNTWFLRVSTFADQFKEYLSKDDKKVRLYIGWCNIEKLKGSQLEQEIKNKSRISDTAISEYKNQCGFRSIKSWARFLQDIKLDDKVHVRTVLYAQDKDMFPLKYFHNDKPYKILVFKINDNVIHIDHDNWLFYREAEYLKEETEKINSAKEGVASNYKTQITFSKVRYNKEEEEQEEEQEEARREQEDQDKQSKSIGIEYIIHLEKLKEQYTKVSQKNLNFLISTLVASLIYIIGISYYLGSTFRYEYIIISAINILFFYLHRRASVLSSYYRHVTAVYQSYIYIKINDNLSTNTNEPLFSCNKDESFEQIILLSLFQPINDKTKPINNELSAMIQTLLSKK